MSFCGELRVLVEEHEKPDSDRLRLRTIVIVEGGVNVGNNGDVCRVIDDDELSSR